jgi:hypothetical protein
MATAFDKVYWVRAGAGILFGLAADYVVPPSNSQIYYYAISLGILGFLVSYYLARLLWFRKLDQQTTSKVFTTGWGVYTMLFVFTWLLLFTLSLVGV